MGIKELTNGDIIEIAGTRFWTPWFKIEPDSNGKKFLPIGPKQQQIVRAGQTWSTYSITVQLPFVPFRQNGTTLTNGTQQSWEIIDQHVDPNNTSASFASNAINLWYKNDTTDLKFSPFSNRDNWLTADKLKVSILDISSNIEKIRNKQLLINDSLPTQNFGYLYVHNQHSPNNSDNNTGLGSFSMPISPIDQIISINVSARNDLSTYSRNDIKVFLPAGCWLQVFCRRGGRTIVNGTGGSGYITDVYVMAPDYSAPDAPPTIIATPYNLWASNSGWIGSGYSWIHLTQISVIKHYINSAVIGAIPNYDGTFRTIN